MRLKSWQSYIEGSPLHKTFWGFAQLWCPNCDALTSVVTKKHSMGISFAALTDLLMKELEPTVCNNCGMMSGLPRADREQFTAELRAFKSKEMPGEKFSEEELKKFYNSLSQNKTECLACPFCQKKELTVSGFSSASHSERRLFTAIFGCRSCKFAATYRELTELAKDLLVLRHARQTEEKIKELQEILAKMKPASV